jgi:hypothetical protein
MYKKTNLLWTGGWDSTYRLLQLLLKESRSVQPYYIHINSRKSRLKEIETMQLIRNRLINDFPKTRRLLAETKFVYADNLNEDASIYCAYSALNSENHIGNQFETLARFADQYPVEKPELCLEKGNFARTFILPYMETVQLNGHFENRISTESAPEQLRKILGRYRFPLVQLTRQKMIESAEQKGWMQIMEMTWFCHHPILNRYACGACNPCMYVKEDGMESRIPFLTRISGKYVKQIYNSRAVIQLRKYSKRFLAVI